MATADANHQVKDIASDRLKKFSFDLEDSYLVGSLYDLYLGTSSSEEKRIPIGIILKINVLGQLSKSKAACSQIDKAVSVCYDFLNPSSNDRVKRAGMSFIFWILRIAEADSLTQHGRLFFDSVSSLLSEKDTETMSFVYDCLL